MINWIGLKMIDESGSKVVIMDWSGTKKFLLIFVVFIFMVFFLAFLLSNTSRINGKEVTFSSFQEKMPFIINILLVFFFTICIGILIFYPKRIIIKKDSNGNFLVNKRDIFFITKENNINSEQNPVFITRKRALTILHLLQRVYEPIIRFNDGRKSEEISLLSISDRMKERGPTGLLRKEEAEKICNFLDIRLKIEE